MNFSFLIFESIVYLFPKSREVEKDQLWKLIDIRKISHCFHRNCLTFVLIWSIILKKEDEKSIELELKLTTEMARVYVMIRCLHRYSRCVCVWLARWRKDRLLASCIVIFSRHPAAGFRSFDHHSRPLPSTSGYHHRHLLDKQKHERKRKEKKNKKWNEMKTALKERAVQHVYVPTLNDLRIVIIIPLFFRGCLSESPPRTLRYFTLSQLQRFVHVISEGSKDRWSLKETHK